MSLNIMRFTSKVSHPVVDRIFAFSVSFRAEMLFSNTSRDIRAHKVCKTWSDGAWKIETYFVN